MHLSPIIFKFQVRVDDSTSSTLTWNLKSIKYWIKQWNGMKKGIDVIYTDEGKKI